MTMGAALGAGDVDGAGGQGSSSEGSEEERMQHHKEEVDKMQSILYIAFKNFS